MTDQPRGQYPVLSSQPVQPTNAKPVPESPVRIVFCITELDPGGAERALWQLLRHLDRRRFEPLVVSLKSGGQIAENVRALGIEVRELGMTRALGLPQAISRLKQMLLDFEPQIVQGFLFHANLVSRIAAKLARVPVVLSGVRVAERRDRGYLWMDRITSGLVDRYICVSQAVASFTVQVGRIPAHKVVVIVNGVDQDVDAAPSWNRQELGIAEGQTALLFVGRLDRQKGIDALLEAMPDLSQSNYGCHLICVGQGPLEGSLKARSQQLGLATRVHFLGYLQEVRGAYQSADLLVLPSRWEGMPNVVLEALASGLPVCVSTVEGIPEIREKTDGIYSIEDLRPATIARSVQNALEAVERRRRDAGCSQVFTFQWDTWKEVAAHYEVCYLKLLSERQKQAPN